MGAITKGLRRVCRRIVPVAVLDAYRTMRYGRTWYDPTGQSVRKVFSEVYRRHLWGGGRGGAPFCSGHGSDKGVAEPYVKIVRQFIEEYGIGSIVDLGCGDFRVGRELICPGLSYHGVDVVKELIEYNANSFSSENVRFSCKDIINDELPNGQLCLIRQVLQHLSNDQVNRVLKQCEQFPYVIITEHLPASAVSTMPNLDIHHGSGTRVAQGSGVYLDLPPFNRRIEKVLVDVKIEDNTVIRTVLLRNERAEAALEAT